MEKEILDYIESACLSVEPVTVSEDDYVWHVYEFYMAKPNKRLCGIGNTVISAVKMAMNNEIIDSLGNPIEHPE